MNSNLSIAITLAQLQSIAIPQLGLFSAIYSQLDMFSSIRLLARPIHNAASFDATMHLIVSQKELDFNVKMQFSFF